MQAQVFILVAILVISVLIADEGKAGNETSDDDSNDNEPNDDESNETSSNNNETSDNTTSENNETKEDSGYCPAEIDEENIEEVDDSCLATFDEEDGEPETSSESLPAVSIVTVLSVISITAFLRRRSYV